MKPLNVLSLFDGMSCGQIALERAGIPVKNYYASEIDKYAIKVTQANYPNTIQLGDITKWREWDLPSINIILAGSPCQGFSFAGKQLEFDDPRSKLFFEFIEILKHYKPKYFFLENVVMSQESNDVISCMLGELYPECVGQKQLFQTGRLEPIQINSALVSAQNRNRLYWTNVLGVEQPEDAKIFVKDITEENPPEYCKLPSGWFKWWNEHKHERLSEQHSAYANLQDKAICMTARQYANWNGNFIYQVPRGNNTNPDMGFDKTPTLTNRSWKDNNIIITPETIRKFSCVECERLQTVEDSYTNHVSSTQRYKMLGNGWTVDVIVHILRGLKVKE